MNLIKNNIKILVALISLIGTLLITNNANSDDRKIVLTSKNSIYLNDSINANSVKFVIESHLRLLKTNKDEIFLVINSPGGSVIDGIDLIDYLKSTTNVTIICKFCASMAFMIFEHHKNDRLVMDSSVLMGHRAKGGFSGQFEDGEVEKKLEFWKSLIRQVEQKVADRLELSLEDYKAKIKDEWWTYGSDILKAKQADEMIQLSCSEELINTTIVRREETLFGTNEFKTNGCPLIPYVL